MRAYLIGLVVLAGCSLDRSLGPPANEPDANVVDSGPGVDASMDSGPPMVDAGVDAGMDAGTDAGTDAGPPDGGCTSHPEACNGIDDDCDGTIDNDAHCPCTPRINGSHSYLFCHGGDVHNRPDARTVCASNGYYLAAIETMAENDWVAMTAQMVDGDHVWWLGGIRGDAPPMMMAFEWEATLEPIPLTGSYQNWGMSQPNDLGGVEDCVAMREDVGSMPPGSWYDANCMNTSDFVCEAGR